MTLLKANTEDITDSPADTFRDLDVPPPVEIFMQTSHLELSSLPCCQSVAKTNTSAYCQVNFLFFCIMEFQRGFLSLSAVYVQCHVTDPCFPYASVQASGHKTVA